MTDWEIVRERLIGVWRGHGRGEFPTMPSFTYRDELRVRAEPDRADLIYEHIAWRDAAGESPERPSHWETGFIRLLSNSQIECVNVQQGGRVEVLRGNIITGADLTLQFESVHLGNDARMLHSARQYTFAGAELRYTMQMATTAVPGLQPHMIGSLTQQP